MATAHTEYTLDLIQEDINAGRTYYLARLDALHQDFLRSPFGNSADVAHLGIELLKVQQPQLFQ